MNMVRPGDRGWDAARGTFNLLIDQQPEAIAFPADAREVAAVVADARERGLRVAAQATGHNAGPLGSLDGTLILNTSALTGVSDRRRAPAACASAPRRAGSRSRRALRARAGGAPRLVAGRRDRRLLAGRRHRLARPQARHADERRDRDRARHRRRPPRPHRPRARARAVLGPARRQRQLRRRHRASSSRCCRCASSTPARCSSRSSRSAEVLHAWTELLPALPDELTSWASVIHFPPLPEVPGAGPRAGVRRSSWRPTSAAEAEGASCCGRCAASARRWTRSRCSRRSRSPSWRWTRATRCPSGPRTPSSTSCPATAIDDIARDRRAGLVADAGPAAAHGRRPRAAARRAPAPAPRCPGESACSASASCPSAAAEPAVRAELDAIDRRGRPAPRRRLPELRRGARRTRAPSSTPTRGRACAG